MPQMANITVKNKAGTDVVYVAKTPSAGDTVPARWMQDAASPIIGRRPRFQVVTRDSGAKNGGRRMFASGTFPIVTGTAPNEVIQLVPFQADTTLPTSVDSALVEEAFVQFGNLLVSALLRAVAAEGYAPT